MIAIAPFKTHKRSDRQVLSQKINKKRREKENLFFSERLKE
jgi:hypothetical protein